MEKRNGIEATQLPEPTIQHIQSFLSAKEASQTAILSKSWHSAWLTRPNLDFSDLDIPSLTEFVRVVRNAMQRYDELNLKIQSLRLLMRGNASYNISLAKELIAKAMKLGATDLDIVTGEWRDFVLPRAVLESETLARLSVVDCTIDLRNQKVSCSRLKSLNLSGVLRESNVIRDIISMNPLIEELVLSNRSYDKSGLYIISALKCGNDFCKLKVLSLEAVEIGEWFFGGVSKLPCLTELGLHKCTGYEKVQICSDSLECVVLIQSEGRNKLTVEFDVPRIRKFKFASFRVPSLSFKTTSREWESDISFECLIDFSWFVELREFLLELSSSKISLSLSIDTFLDRWYHYANHMIYPAIVEKLTLLMSAPSSVQSTLLMRAPSSVQSAAIFAGLFWSCRPNFITLYFSSKYVDKNVVNLIRNTLVKEERGNRNTSALYDLEEVNIQVSGHTVWTWSRPLPANTLDTSSWNNTEVCLQLKWG